MPVRGSFIKGDSHCAPIARFLATGYAQTRHLLAQQSTSKRQMRWISTDLCISSTWFSLVWGEGVAAWSSRGAIQRSEIGSYHLLGVTTCVSPLHSPRFLRLSHAPVSGVLGEIAVGSLLTDILLLVVAMAFGGVDRNCRRP